MILVVYNGIYIYMYDMDIWMYVSNEDGNQRYQQQ